MLKSMKSMIKRFGTKLTSKFFTDEDFNPDIHQLDIYVNRSYSQEGEDLLLLRFFEKQKTGFYVDIGAHHPIRFSNTYLFYQKGWHGINIDPIPCSEQLFDKFRPNDINIEYGVSSKKVKLKYYNFKEKALNTFSETLAQQYIQDSWELENTIDIITIPLKDIFDQHLTPSKKIDFMSVDVEGFEMEVLTSNDWSRYKPEILLIEILNCPMEEISKNKIALFLKDLGYVSVAKTFNTFFFRLK